jgi:polyhydroxyalkanoate synthesis repressor PhaR
MSDPQPIPARTEPKVIKRYTNRKLYDTVESRYVTLDEIAEMVKQGIEVKIVDNRTKEDLTSVTLAQIVFEEEKKKSQMPLDVLREIIRRPGDTLTDFFKSEVSPRVASIREEAESRLDKLLGRDGDEPAAPAASPPRDAKEPKEPKKGLLEQAQRGLEDFQKQIDERVNAVVQNVVGNLPAMGRDMAALVQRIDQLEKKIEALEQKKR